jgi:flavin reductase (DIM6/NTAB) family NADH-FMN oxidoreductase RutF
MFYEPAKNDHGLPHDPFKAIVTPRPIGWVTTIGKSGEINLAPYSYFNAVSTRPPCVMFASEGYKDSVANIAETGEFVCNLAVWDLRDQVNQTSATFPRGVNEMDEAGLAPAPSRLVKPPRVARAPCAMECKLLQVVPLHDLSGKPLDRHITIGQVVGVHIDDRFIKNGLLDTAAMQPIARCGYHEYAVVTSLFEMVRPG